MIYSVIDIEANGLLYATRKAKKATKIHCLAYTRYNGITEEKGVLTRYDEIANFLANEKWLIGHNIIRYDIPLLEKLLKIKITASLIDTLGLSWYLYPKRTIHGLEEWGKDFGIEKPPVVDWDNSPLEVYTFRCGEDVRINCKLFDAQRAYLELIYGKGNILRIMTYLSYKLDCAREAEETRWRLDVIRCNVNLIELEAKLNEKRYELGLVMPIVIEYKTVSRPGDRYYKKDGTISKAGERWEEILHKQRLPLSYTEDVTIEASRSMGNPNSPDQLKEWLFSLGWVPESFKYVREAAGDGSGRWVQRAIPQIMSLDDTGVVCASIKKMFPKYPFLVNLEEYSVLKHRIGLLKGFLRDVSEDGYLQAEISGFTNTLRFQHKTIVNLPQIPKKYWEEVRGCLIAPNENYELCGADMSGLEDNTKQHYMYYFDPEYVKQLRTPGYDSHIDIAVRARAMSYEEGECYKWFINKKEGKDYAYTPTKEFNPFDNAILKERITFESFIKMPEALQTKIVTVLKPIRLKNKKGNFAAVYGAGPVKLAVTLSIPLNEAKAFHTAYWVRNKAVKKVANSCKVKSVNGQSWVYNPVSRFWLTLRDEKDRFSTLNQSTGVYCFDTWNMKVRARGWKLCGQFHDEIIAPIIKTQRAQLTADINKAIEETNAILKLNVPLGISIAFGQRYSDIH